MRWSSPSQQWPIFYCLFCLPSPTSLYDLSLEKNEEQSRAVYQVVAGTSRPAPYLIFGPPGTGKTVTMVEAIKQVRSELIQYDFVTWYSTIFVVYKHKCISCIGHVWILLSVVNSFNLLLTEARKIYVTLSFLLKLVPKKLIAYAESKRLLSFEVTSYRAVCNLACSHFTMTIWRATNVS